MRSILMRGTLTWLVLAIAFTAPGCRWLFPQAASEDLGIEPPQYVDGVLTSHEQIGLQDAIDATQAALERLQITIEEIDRQAGLVQGRTVDEKEVRVELRQRRRGTQLSIAVLPEGIEARERMILDQIRRQLS